MLCVPAISKNTEAADRYARIQFVENHSGVAQWRGVCRICEVSRDGYVGKTSGFAYRTAEEAEEWFVQEHFRTVHMDKMKCELRDLIDRSMKKLGEPDLTPSLIRQLRVGIEYYAQELRFLHYMK